ncbi:MAG: 30S ribosomal protein S9 [Myxococcota bacterium]|nr:30S ribosomal protein S9 [Myxococcota bacterium]
MISAATGKRKNAIARVQLSLGTGTIMVNGRKADEYFPREALQIDLRRPLEMTGSTERFDIKATVTGGGVAGQAGAVRHGIARALEKNDPNQRATLKREGMLTRDPRRKERKKYGQKGARARFQFSKR